MGPETLRLYSAYPELRAGLASAQHWGADRAVLEVLAELDDGLTNDGDPWVFQLDLPSDDVVLELDTGRDVVVARFVRDASGDVILFVKIKGLLYFCAGVFRPRAASWRPSSAIPAAANQIYIEALAKAADLLFALAAEPRLVRQVPPSRPQRRRVAKAVGFVPAVWKNISWTVGETVTPARRSGHPEHGMPLHIVRAHWRKYPRGTARAVRRAGHPGWWTWVSHHFRGHPAYGVKLHRYRPKIGEQSSGVIRDVAAAATLHAATAAIKGWNNGRQDR